MQNNKVLKHIITAMFIALVCIATMIIRIPTPTNGYINLGDCFVLLSGWLLGPVYGVIAAGVGSMLADFIAGYSIYAIATLIIKSIMCFLAWSIFTAKKNIAFQLISAITAEAFMAFSYFLFECVFLGQGLAASFGLAANIMQGVVGILLSIPVFLVFKRNRILSKYISIFKK